MRKNQLANLISEFAFTIAIAALLIAGCAKNDINNYAKKNEVFSSAAFSNLYNTAAEININATQQTFNIDVNEKVGNNWNVSLSYPEGDTSRFVQITPLNSNQSGSGKITITCAANTFDVERQAVIRVSYKNDEVFTTQLTQAANAISIKPGKELILHNGASADTVSVIIANSQPLEYVKTSDSWFTITTTPDNKLVCHVDKNFDLAERTGKVYIRYSATHKVIDSIILKQGLPVVTEDETSYNMPLTGNSYLTSGPAVTIPTLLGSPLGLVDVKSVVSAFGKVYNKGTYSLGFIASPTGPCEVKLKIMGKEFIVPIAAAATDKFYSIGTIDMMREGYIRMDISATSNPASTNLKSIRIGGPGVADGWVTFVYDDNLANPADQWEYWGRRGPSVHMNYDDGLPANTEYFYNEVTVPAGSDVNSSFFMTNGFNGGYCGLQVTGNGTKTIHFSVWCDYSADSYSSVPANLRLTTLRTPAGVTIEPFGGEGTGIKCYKQFNWKTGVTYKVLTQVKYFGIVDGHDCTDFTAYVYDPEQSKWMLLGSLRRPQQTTSPKIASYTDANSFLENFEPTQGWITREVHFGNLWARNLSGNWLPVTKAAFTNDNTAQAGIREDYYGGIQNNQFVLKNCGFFDYYTSNNTDFTLSAAPTSPVIDLEALKALQ